ncbi:prohead core scaffold and protease [Lake Baikal phage Baikal-20-5m-C28]|nr:prohead core scaffold and protease [Lake Baikal phage Baikal-20-5m-C28]
MKLMLEQMDSDIHVITEAKQNGSKDFFIEGIFMMADSKNRNGRIYESKILQPAVERYITEQVKTGRAVGELNHPDGPTINLDKVSHLITNLRFENNNVIGKAKILNTPMGQIVKGLLEGGVKLGVSSRGMGSLETRNGVNYVKDDFHLATVDIVQDPSAPSAFVNGIMEGVDWIYNNGVFKPQEIEKIETEIKRTPKAQLAEAQVRVFKHFLSKL